MNYCVPITDSIQTLVFTYKKKLTHSTKAKVALKASISTFSIQRSWVARDPFGLYLGSILNFKKCCYIHKVDVLSLVAVKSAAMNKTLSSALNSLLMKAYKLLI